MPSTSPYLSFFYEALESPFGIALSVSDTSQAKAQLYKARAEGMDPSLSQISIHQSPFLPDTEVWLVKRPKKSVANGTDAETNSAEPDHSDEGAD